MKSALSRRQIALQASTKIMAQIEILHRQSLRIHVRGGIDPLILSHRNFSRRGAL